MPIAKELALKILGALAVGGTVVGGGIALGRSMKGTPKNNAEDTGKDPTNDQGVEGNTDTDNVNTGDNDPKPAETLPEEAPVTSEVLKELGLKCVKDSFCTLETGKSLSVKQEDNTRTLTALPAGQGGKIRIHKSEEDEKNSTFSIEGGDITPTWGSGGSSSITKLEEFETYEIEEETVAEGEKKYHFKRKTKALDEKLRILGLTGSGCTLSIAVNNKESSTSSTCDLDKDKLKAINFEGKTQNKDPTMTETGKATLTITRLKSNDPEYSKYPMNYKFVLSGGNEVKIPASPNEIVKKANVSLEFKIKVTSQANGPRTLTLEKVSQLDRLAAKVNLTECKTEAKTCKFPRTGLNVYKNGSNNIRGATITSPGDHIVTFQEDVSGYEGEIKFTVSSDISVSGSNIKGTFSKIDQGNYEIKQQTVDDQTLWYLSKKN